MGFNIEALGTDTSILETEGAAGGFTDREPPREGPSLFRLIGVVELGREMGEYQGTPKEQSPVILTFELVHPDHAVRKEDGEFIFNHTVRVNLNKSNSDKSKYMKLFNKLNYAGAVAVPKGKVPSFAPFLGQPFYGNVYNNKSEKTGKTYTNLNKPQGEFEIGAPRVAAIDPATGIPTGDFNEIDVPLHSGDITCFLWETGVTDAVYQDMWASIERENNWMQEFLLSDENIALPGSRAESLFKQSAATVDAAIAAASADVPTPADVAAPAETPATTGVDVGISAAPAVDPLAGLVTS